MQINEQLFIQESFVLIIIFPLAGTEKMGLWGEWNAPRLLLFCFQITDKFPDKKLETAEKRNQQSVSCY
jgi:hypothetical protein